MSGLDVAASIAGLISIADLLFSRTFKYTKTARNASKDIEKLANSIRSLTQLLHGLHLILLELEEESPETNFRLHHINSCSTTLTRIREKLDKNGYDAGPDEAHPPKAKLSLLHKLKWPYSCSETKELVLEIERHMGVINVALSGDTLATVLRALSRQDNMAAEIKGLRNEQTARWASETHIRLSKKRQEVIAFFGKNPSNNHKTSLKLRQPMTGLWLTEGSTFQAWLHSRNSKLWLSGIPGAGKTVIAASAIEEAMNESSAKHAVAYFYCDYKDSEKQDPIRILGSLAAQLARQNETAFTNLEQLYEACHPNDKPAIDPDLDALLLKTRDMALNFDDVSIIVDGLDECGIQTSEVVQSLVSLSSSDNSNTRTLCLSRDEPQIKQLLGHYVHLEIAAHNEDLKLYVAAEIEARQKKVGRGQLRFKSKKTDLKEHIMKTLIDRAQGMFRWVACQLDYICELPTDALKREALTSLPPTLHATYERILDRVNENDTTIQVMVQRTLQWLINSASFSVDALCTAVSIQNGVKYIEEESLYDEEDILLHCSSLLRRSASGGTLELAHFTVQEFLRAILPDKTPSYEMYSQDKDLVFPQLAITCLTYINLECFHGEIIEKYDVWENQQAEHPFRATAVRDWVFYAEGFWENHEIQSLALDLFDPSRTNCFLAWTRDYIYDSGLHEPPPPPPPPPSPSSPPTPFRIPPVKSFEDAKIDKFNQITINVCIGGVLPLHMAAFLPFPELFQIQLALGGNINQISSIGTPLQFALFSYSEVNGLYSFSTGRKTPMLKSRRDTKSDKVVSRLKMLVAVGALSDKALIETLKEELYYIDKYSQNVDVKIVDVLVKILEKDQARSVEQAEVLEMLLKLSGTGSYALKFMENDVSSLSTIEDGAVSFRSGMRFDQIGAMRELLKDRKAQSKHLKFAIDTGNLELCERIVELTFDVDQSFCSCRCKPLLYALDHKPHETTSRASIARYFVNKGFSSKGRLCSHSVRRGYSAIHLACRYQPQIDLLKTFLVQDFETGGLAFQGPVSPLHVAVANKNLPALKLLLQHLRDHYPEGSLRDSSDASHQSRRLPETAQERRQTGRFSIVDMPIDSSKLLWDWPLFQNEFLTPENFVGWSCLHIAAYFNKTEAIEILLEHGANIDPVNSNYETPLHLAILQKHYKCVSMLLKFGSNIDVQDGYGDPAVFVAAFKGDLEILKLVSKSEMDFGFRSDNGATLLHRAAKGGSLVFSHLLHLGFDPYIQDGFNESPVKFLLEEHPDCLALVCNLNLDFHKLTGLLFGQNSMDSLRSRRRIQFLLKRLPAALISREIDSPGPGGRSPLGIAARLEDMAILGLLIGAGANLELESRMDGTPLLIACAIGSLPTVKYLVRAGASPFGRRNGESVTAVEAAVSFPRIVRWLLVERYTDQHQITCGTDVEREISHWAGVISVEMDLSELPYSPIRDASSLEFVKEMSTLRRNLRGTVLDI